MTKGQFWAELRASGGGWSLSDDGAIRRRGATIATECPVTAVANRLSAGSPFPTMRVWLAADALGLERGFALRVIRAADGWSDADPEIGRRLHSAVRLGRHARQRAGRSPRATPWSPE